MDELASKVTLGCFEANSSNFDSVGMKSKVDESTSKVVFFYSCFSGLLGESEGWSEKQYLKLTSDASNFNFCRGSRKQAQDGCAPLRDRKQAQDGCALLGSRHKTGAHSIGSRHKTGAH